MLLVFFTYNLDETPTKKTPKKRKHDETKQNGTKVEESFPVETAPVVPPKENYPEPIDLNLSDSDNSLFEEYFDSVPKNKSLKFFVNGMSESLGRKLFLRNIKGSKQLYKHIADYMLEKKYKTSEFDVLYKENGDDRYFMLKYNDDELYWRDFLQNAREITVFLKSTSTKSLEQQKLTENHHQSYKLDLNKLPQQQANHLQTINTLPPQQGNFNVQENLVQPTMSN